MIDIIDRPLQMVAADSLGSEEGLAARAAGVTASELHAIAVGGRGTWRRIRDGKLNGATFHGNQHTKRGHEREPYLLAWACSHVAFLEPNRALFAHPDNPLIMATPDGLGIEERGGEFGVEVKSHEHTWGDRYDIPAEHYDQMQVGMAVTGIDRWLYVWEVMGEDGTPTLETPRFRWVERDEKRIAKLLKEAEAFLAWRAAGAPVADDDLPEDVDDALAIIAAADEAIAPHKKARDAALKIVRAHAEATADEYGSKGAGLRGSFTYSKTTAPVLDEDAWIEAEPHTHEAWLSMQKRVDAARAAAAALYHRDEISTRLNTEKTKDAA